MVATVRAMSGKSCWRSRMLPEQFPSMAQSRRSHNTVHYQWLQYECPRELLENDPETEGGVIYLLPCG